MAGPGADHGAAAARTARHRAPGRSSTRGRASLALEDLEGESWIGVPAGYPYDWVYREIERLTGTTPRITQRFSDTRITEALVGAGLGIAVLPRFTSAACATTWSVLPLEGMRAVRHLSVLMRPDRAERPSVRRVVDALRAEASRVATLHGTV